MMVVVLCGFFKDIEVLILTMSKKLTPKFKYQWPYINDKTKQLNISKAIGRNLGGYMTRNIKILNQYI